MDSVKLLLSINKACVELTGTDIPEECVKVIHTYAKTNENNDKIQKLFRINNISKGDYFEKYSNMTLPQLKQDRFWKRQNSQTYNVSSGKNGRYVKADHVRRLTHINYIKDADEVKNKLREDYICNKCWNKKTKKYVEYNVYSAHCSVKKNERAVCQAIIQSKIDLMIKEFMEQEENEMFEGVEFSEIKPIGYIKSDIKPSKFNFNLPKLMGLGAYTDWNDPDAKYTLTTGWGYNEQYW